MEAFAVKHGNFGYMNNIILCTKQVTDTNQADFEKREEERHSWVQASAKANSDIILSIKLSELTHIKGCTRAY